MQLQHDVAVNPLHFRARFLKQLSDWLGRRCGFPAHFVWILENPPFDEKGLPGLHLHLICHVPISLRRQFRSRLKIWLVTSGGRKGAHALNRKAVRHSKPHSEQEDYITSGLWGLVRYLLKGIDPDVAPKFGVRPVNQGVISGKRLGYSEALGMQHRWHPQLLRGDRRLLLPGQDSRRRNWVKAVCPDFLGIQDD